MSVRDFVKNSKLVTPYIQLMKVFSKKVTSQSNEAEIVQRLVDRHPIHKTFVEFGFSGWEFNCCELATHGWNGLLIDGDRYNVNVARQILPSSIKAKQLWLDIHTLDFIIEYQKNLDLGILSIDVDGNDYWFLKKLIALSPSLIIIEFNPFFGHRPISIPYDSKFDRKLAHPEMTYYGASLSALSRLASLNGYSLIDISSNSVNAFFIKNEILSPQDIVLDPSMVIEEILVRGRHGLCMQSEWEKISNLKYIDVTLSNDSIESIGSSIRF